MGVDTKGLIRTSNKDVFTVFRAVQKVLSTLTDNKTEIWATGSRRADILSHTKLCNGYFVTSFYDNVDARQLFVFFNCDCDQSEKFPGEKIIFNLGCWGRSGFIIEQILKELTHLGECWMIENDCSSNWVKIE